MGQLPSEYRTAFAAACAQRLLPRYTGFYTRLRDESVEGEPLATKFLDLLWHDLWEGGLDDKKIETMIKRLLASLPDENMTLAANEPYCSDAGAAVVFSLQSRLTGQIKFAILPARRLYHALDNFVLNTMFPNKPLISESDEEIALAHPLIQRELVRQQSDLDMLNSAYERDHDKAIVFSNLRQRAEDQSSQVFRL